MNKFLLFLAIIISTSSYATDVIVPSTAGGALDIVARRFAQYVESNNNDNLTIENFGGAGGQIGLSKLLKSDPNTIGIISSSYYINLIENKFQPDDFIVVSIMAESPLFILSNKNISCEELRSGNRFFIGTGAGGHTSFIAKLIHDQYPNIIEVPYKGVKQAVLDTVGGHIDLVLAGASEISNNLRVIADTKNSFNSCLKINKSMQVEWILLANKTSSPEFIEKMNRLSVKFANEDKLYYKENLMTSAASNLETTKQHAEQSLKKWKDIVK